MPRVDFRIGNQTFDLACEEGEQERIQQLAVSLNERVIRLTQSLGKAPDALILAVTALMMEDEIRSMKEAKSSSFAAELEENNLRYLQQTIDEILNPVILHIESLAEKVENL